MSRKNKPGRSPLVRIGAIFAFTGALLIAVGIVVGNEMKQFGE